MPRGTKFEQLHFKIPSIKLIHQIIIKWMQSVLWSATVRVLLVGCIGLLESWSSFSLLCQCEFYVSTSSLRYHNLQPCGWDNKSTERIVCVQQCTFTFGSSVILTYQVMRLLTSLLNRQQVKISLDRSLHWVYLQRRFAVQLDYGPMHNSVCSGKPLVVVSRQKCSYMDQIKSFPAMLRVFQDES